MNDRARIRGTVVPAAYAPQGPIWAVVMGEAPGPLGADKSAIPFWGDRAGLYLYRALERAGYAQVPAAAWEHWRGEDLARLGLRPHLQGLLLTNSLPYCPTDDGHKFRAPKSSELFAAENLKRFTGELRLVEQQHANGTLHVIALGGKAQQFVGRFLESYAQRQRYTVHAVAHPSAQGLLSTAPNRGKGASLEALGENWVNALAAKLTALENAAN